MRRQHGYLSESENAHMGEDDGSDGETDGDANPMVRAVLLLLFCVLLPVTCHTVPTGSCRASWQEPDDEQMELDDDAAHCD